MPSEGMDGRGCFSYQDKLDDMKLIILVVIPSKNDSENLTLYYRQVSFVTTWIQLMMPVFNVRFVISNNNRFDFLVLCFHKFG